MTTQEESRTQIINDIEKILGRHLQNGFNAGLFQGDWSSFEHLQILTTILPRFGIDLTAHLVRDLTSINAIATHIRGTAASPDDEIRP